MTEREILLDSLDLPAVSESSLKETEMRMRGRLKNAGFLFTKEREVNRRDAVEVMWRVNNESSFERWHPDHNVSNDEIMRAKEGVDEIVGSWLSGFLTTGTWVFLDKELENLYSYSGSFIDYVAHGLAYQDSTLRHDRKKSKRTNGPPMRAKLAFIKELAYEYLRPLTAENDERERKLSGYLQTVFPKIITADLVNEVPPIMILDTVLTQYVINSASKTNSDPAFDVLAEGVVLSYVDNLTGRIHKLDATKRKAKERLDKRIQVHELLHRLATSTNGGEDDYWVCKVGLRTTVVAR